jgi:hypothetical protein
MKQRTFFQCGLEHSRIVRPPANPAQPEMKMILRASSMSLDVFEHLSETFAAMIARVDRLSQQQARQTAAACLRLDGWTRAKRPKLLR